MVCLCGTVCGLAGIFGVGALWRDRVCWWDKASVHLMSPFRRGLHIMNTAYSSKNAQFPIR